MKNIPAGESWGGYPARPVNLDARNRLADVKGAASDEQRGLSVSQVALDSVDVGEIDIQEIMRRIPHPAVSLR